MDYKIVWYERYWAAFEQALKDNGFKIKPDYMNPGLLKKFPTGDRTCRTKDTKALKVFPGGGYVLLLIDATYARNGCGVMACTIYIGHEYITSLICKYLNIKNKPHSPMINLGMISCTNKEALWGPVPTTEENRYLFTNRPDDYFVREFFDKRYPPLEARVELNAFCQSMARNNGLAIYIVSLMHQQKFDEAIELADSQLREWEGGALDPRREKWTRLPDYGFCDEPFLEKVIDDCRQGKLLCGEH